MTINMKEKKKEDKYTSQKIMKQEVKFKEPLN